MSTVKRFLVYSLDHDRPVKALFADTLQYRNIRVTALTEDTVTFRTAGRKTETTVPLDAILSVYYARGDDGDTLKYARPSLAEEEEQRKP